MCKASFRAAFLSPHHAAQHQHTYQFIVHNKIFNTLQADGGQPPPPALVDAPRSKATPRQNGGHFGPPHTNITRLRRCPLCKAPLRTWSTGLETQKFPTNAPSPPPTAASLRGHTPRLSRTSTPTDSTGRTAITEAAAAAAAATAAAARHLLILPLPLVHPSKPIVLSPQRLILCHETAQSLLKPRQGR